jgi:Lhr-like helicase
MTHVILQHFSFEMQYLLDDFNDNKIDFERLLRTYNDIGTETYNLREMEPFLKECKKHRVRIYAGVLP